MGIKIGYAVIIGSPGPPPRTLARKFAKFAAKKMYVNYAFNI